MSTLEEANRRKVLSLVTPYCIFDVCNQDCIDTHPPHQVELVYGAVNAVIQPTSSVDTLYAQGNDAAAEREAMSTSIRDITRMYFQSQEEVRSSMATKRELRT